jgi:hypothetical protein
MISGIPLIGNVLFVRADKYGTQTLRSATVQLIYPISTAQVASVSAQQINPFGTAKIASPAQHLPFTMQMPNPVIRVLKVWSIINRSKIVNLNDLVFSNRL